MDIKKEFGKNLKKIRVEKKLTQEKLTELSGIDRVYISEIECGKKNISLEKIYALSIALDISLGELLTFHIKEE